MLWELLLDELQINLNSTTIVQNIKTVFDGNINLFKTRANPSAGLMNLNKQFLNQLLIAVNQLFPNLKQEQQLLQQQQQMKRINISEEVLLDEPYKVEDIHNARQTDFEKQFLNKRNEFEKTINAKKPQPIDFSDKAEPDSKITEMESLIAETMAKRKYEIEQLQGMPSSQTRTESKLDVNLQTKSETKSINKKTEKTVSFNDNVTYEHIDNNENIENNVTNEENIINMNNIFSKLKKNINISQNELDKDKTLEEKIDKLSQKIDRLFTITEQILNNLYINQEKSS
jgi:hypothetical protein